MPDSRCQCPPGRTASGERCACKLRLSKITRVDLVDRPASFDPISGEGSAVLIAKGGGAAMMTVQDVNARVFVEKVMRPSAPRPTVHDAREAEALVVQMAEALVWKSQVDLTREQAVARVLSTEVGRSLYAVSCAGRVA
jgi:hypothetical protein